MSEIALYNALTKLGLPPDEAKEAVVDIANAKEVATKSDLKTGLASLKADLIERIYAVSGVIIIVNTAAVGLMIKFL